MLRVIGRRLRDYWIYFKTGHSMYLVYTMSIMNFIVLQHRLLITTIPALEKIFSRLYVFVAFFFITYIPLAMVIGYFEFKKGEIRRRPMLNPYAQDQIEAHILQSSGILSYINGDIDEAKMQLSKSQQILSKWKNPP